MEPAKDDSDGIHLGSIGKSELEKLAIAAIREHRQAIDSDQSVYEEWLRASNNPLTSDSVLRKLQSEYLQRQERAAEQQEELSRILDALGFVPDVPPDAGN